jgi:two-component system, chemotaxis family, protein-glutamate methylesterase/glutaminase
MSSPDLVRVLVVDDSAYVRKVVTQMLSRSPSIEVVGTARDGREALERVEEVKPDVVTCDLIMPELDGVGFVREQMARRPVPIVIVSVASEAGELVLNALDAGAVDFIQKPTALASDRLLEMSDDLIAKVRTAAASRVRHVNIAPATPKQVDALVTRGAFDIVVIGISTGGPQALRSVIPRLPAALPVPVAIVLHMPVGYTELYAQKLNEASPLNVREADEGLILEAGMVLIAPAGRHLSVRRNGVGVRAHLDAKPLDAPYRPSVDVLFQSAADVYGSRVLAVVMTGMGSDGRDGAAWIKAKGGTVITESEESCVVYGMPRSIDEAGLSDRSISLDAMADAILGYL